MMAAQLSDGQVQIALGYLYDVRPERRHEAICTIVENHWQHAQLLQALAELTALDEDERVRHAAGDALAALHEDKYL
jgi:hypothetical protein